MFFLLSKPTPPQSFTDRSRSSGEADDTGLPWDAPLQVAQNKTWNDNDKLVYLAFVTAL